MSAIGEVATRLVRGLSNLLPGPPPSEPPPPDIDGRRDVGAEDDIAAVKVQIQGKDGHGGVR